MLLPKTHLDSEVSLSFLLLRHEFPLRFELFRRLVATLGQAVEKGTLLRLVLRAGELRHEEVILPSEG